MRCLSEAAVQLDIRSRAVPARGGSEAPAFHTDPTAAILST